MVNDPLVINHFFASNWFEDEIVRWLNLRLYASKHIQFGRIQKSATMISYDLLKKYSLHRAIGTR